MVGTVNDDNIPPDDSISRIDALTLVGGSLGYDETETADYLADCAHGPMGHGRVEWTSHNEIVVDYVAGPFPGQEAGLQPPSLEQLERAIRSRLWEQARQGAPGVHVKGDLATYRAAVVPVPKPFDGGRLGDAWQLQSAPEEGATPTGPEWTVKSKFKLIKFRLSQLVAELRSDGGLLEAGLARLRSLGRASPALLAAIDPPPANPMSASKPIPQRGKLKQRIAQTLNQVTSEGYTQAGYVDGVLVSRHSDVTRKTLVTRLSELVREEPKLWRGLRRPERKPAAKAATSRR